MDVSLLQLALPTCQVRGATLQDVPGMTALIARLTTALLGYADASESEVRDDLVGERFDITRDTVLALSPDGDVLVYAQAYDEHDDAGWIDVYLDPSLHDFDTVADAAVATCLAHLQGAVSARSAARTRVKAGIYQQESRMQAAYERAGLEVETRYWRMEVDLEPTADYSYDLDDDVSLRKVDPADDAVLRTAADLYNETFREHHGHVDVSPKGFAEQWRRMERFDPEAWWFALQGGEAIGLLIGDDTRVHEGIGFVRTLGVHRQARGRGIAKALLLTAFNDYRRRGRRAVQLGVDSANVTGATRLYEGVGMRPVLTTVAMGRELTV